MLYTDWNAAMELGLKQDCDEARKLYAGEGLSGQDVRESMCMEG
jgi:hypothetical protein